MAWAVWKIATSLVELLMCGQGLTEILSPFSVKSFRSFTATCTIFITKSLKYNHRLAPIHLAHTFKQQENIKHESKKEANDEK